MICIFLSRFYRLFLAFPDFFSDQFLLHPWFFSTHILLIWTLPFLQDQIVSLLTLLAQWTTCIWSVTSSSSWAYFIYVINTADNIHREKVLPSGKISDWMQKIYIFSGSKIVHFCEKPFRKIVINSNDPEPLNFTLPLSSYIWYLMKLELLWRKIKMCVVLCCRELV